MPRVEEHSVIELGAGTGVVGLYCARLGARSVTLTDLDEVTPLLELNGALNAVLAADAAAEGGVRACALPWGDSALPPGLRAAPPSLVVLSDVVYDPEGYAPLVASLRALVRAREDAGVAPCLIVMAHRHRNPEDHRFFELAARHFAMFELPDPRPAPGSPAPRAVPFDFARRAADAGAGACGDVRVLLMRSSEEGAPL